MKVVTLHLEMSDAAAEELTDEAMAAVDSDELIGMTIGLSPTPGGAGRTYEKHAARVIAIGQVPA